MRFALPRWFLVTVLIALAGCDAGVAKRGDKVVLDDGQKLASLVTEFADTGDSKSVS